MSQFTQLIMGCARVYWTDVLITLCDEFNRENYTFKWSDAYGRTQKYNGIEDREVIVKKHLTRLRSSEWIIKCPKDRKEKVSKWKICPTAIKMYNEYVKILDERGERFHNDMICMWENINNESEENITK